MCKAISTSREAIQTKPDVYGQVHPDETPAKIRTALEEFDLAVQQRVATNAKKDGSLILALSRCPELLTDDFKLMFLRCEVFQVDKAVARYSAYWKKRVRLFGVKAFQPLTLDQALSDDQVALEKGFITWVEGAKDPKGRAILVADPAVQDQTYTSLSMVRAIWYTFHTALTEMESAQKHGIVLCFDPSKASMTQFDRKVAQHLAESIQGTIPVRLAAVHICKPPSFVAILLPIMKMFLNERMRKRIKIHPGDDQKVIASIAKYGLSKDSLPTTLGGNIRHDATAQLKARKSRGQ